MTQLFENPIYNALTSSSDKWFSFQKKYLVTHSRIEISQFRLENIDFTSYEFQNCHFLGVIFSEVNLDKSHFISCFFSGCRIEFSGFVGTICEDINLKNVIITDCIFRQSSFSSMTLNKCNIQKCTLKNSYVEKIISVETNTNNNKLTDVDFIKTDMRNCTINKLNGSNLRLQSIRVSNVCINNGALMEIDACNMEVKKNEVKNLVFTNLHINKSEIKDTIIIKSSYSCCSYNNCILMNQNLIDMGINVNVFFQSAFLDCKWPSQTYKVGLLGKYTPSVNLLKQPVEDITGLPSKLRNEIQKAQLVDETNRKASTWNFKLWLWFWGITTEYGRSLLRLTNTCLMLMFIMIIFFVLFNLKESFYISQMPQYLYNAMTLVFFNFIGISVDYPILTLTNEQNIILIIDRILGVVFMGLWIGIATNKIGTID